LKLSLLLKNSNGILGLCVFLAASLGILMEALIKFSILKSVHILPQFLIDGFRVFFFASEVVDDFLYSHKGPI